MGHPIPARKPDRVLIYKKRKRSYNQEDFAVPTDHKGEMKNEKRYRNTWILPEN